jgi:hypothetical protein
MGRLVNPTWRRAPEFYLEPVADMRVVDMRVVEMRVVDMRVVDMRVLLELAALRTGALPRRIQEL